ncbi:PREDICTED: uncharacterized protein LOC109228493 isoform X2 [Nicotiana attenuata]|uniref:uncharacterized protein LOC109228493 isoform X2 n=1 Tax=Nicotiana attenuata TaxID=49451 RepID=UPI0009049718|nr:PREDICTED: uncharacterized protein LOC109228493 isoform X2 [Nicotiana attenuata]
MPGTIQVSVLDFKNISSPAPSSSICLWVSMGKRAYQTWDKGDFSFPLTTFRENLVVRLQDAEGNEISRAEVQTLSIVEKGYWDDFFQLEGGDYVHMKLQFILSEDERNRIRNVRESALKKKKYIVPATNVEYKGTTIPVGDTFASSPPIRRKFSDRSEATSSSPVKEMVQIQYSEPDRPSAKKLQTPVIRDYISIKPVNEQDAQSMLKKDVAAKKESVPQKTIIDPFNKSEDQSAQSMLKIDLAAKKESISQTKIVDPSNKPGDQGVLKKTPSSVRNMISAFETGLAQKGRRSLTRNRASKSQPNLVGIGGSVKDLYPEDTARPNKMSALRVARPLNGNLPEPQSNIGKRGEISFPEQDIVGKGQPVFHEKLKQSSVHIVTFNEAGSSQQETLRSAEKESNTGATSPVDLMRGESSSLEQDIVGTGQPVFHEQLKQSSVDIVPFNEAGSSQQDTLRSAKKESNAVTTSPVDLMRLSNLETATSSQIINVAHSDMLKANNLAADQDRSNDPSVAEQQNREIRSEALLEVHIERVSNEKPKLIAYCENEHYDSENSGVWIFPDNKNRVCITTAGESAVHLLEDCHIGVDDHQRDKKPPKQEIKRKHGFFHRSDSTIKKGGEKPRKPRKSQSESSGQNGPFGPVRQVIKIAVIVGFGILVLLTRQKEIRRNDRKSKEFYFASPDFMDQLASSEEKWSLLTAEGN